jgi:hypothetical protein
MHQIPILDANGLRRFAISTAAAVAAVFGVALPLLGWPLYWWPWVVAAALIFWGLIAPGTLRPIYRGWMRFGLLLNRVTGPLVLGMAFFVAFVPIGAIMRLLGHDPMRRRADDQAHTYREPSQEASRESMEKPF